jgi:predicted Zn-dependent protease
MRNQLIGKQPLSALMVSAITVLMLGGMASAQVQPQPQQDQLSSQQARLQQIQQHLSMVQQMAIDESPDLQAANEEIDALVMEKIEDQGHDPEAMIQNLSSLQEEYKSEDLTEQDRQEILQEFQGVQQQLQVAQQTALQDSQIVAAQEVFRENLLEAMREHEPATDDLIEEFEQIQQKMLSGLEPPQVEDHR